MATHANPKRNGHLGNICGFCNFLEANVPLRSRSVGGVEFDDKIKGRCLAVSGVTYRTAGYSACPKFQLSNDASKYAK